MGLVKYNNISISAVTSAAAIPSGAMTHIKTLTASSSSTLSFVDGSSDVVLDSTYPIYVFKFINMHPATNDVNFTFNMSVDTGSNYNVTKTTTKFVGLHTESGGTAAVEYEASNDLGQSTDFQILSKGLGNGNDECYSGNLMLFNPASSVFVKHFLSTGNENRSDDAAVNDFVAGYGNTTSAVDAVQFKMSSGNIDAGTIKLYGIKDS